MKKAAIHLIRIYQTAVSPLLGMRCRFYPSCSEYMKQSIEHRGMFRGMFAGLKRLSSCHPFHPGGVDECIKVSEHV